MEIKVGNYYYYYGDLCKIISVDTTFPLFEFDFYGDAEPLCYDSMVRFYEYSDVDRSIALKLLKEGKFYHQGDVGGHVKPAYKKIKDTALARKVYPEILKEEEGYLYVKI
jgi:hypothetical protein